MVFTPAANYNGPASFTYTVSDGQGDRLPHPEIVEQLKKEFDKWEAQMKEPLWPCRKPGGDWEFEGVNLDPCV